MDSMKFDMLSIAAALYEGGWRSTDPNEIDTDLM